MAWVESYKVNGTSFDNERFAITRVEQSNPGLKGGNLVPAMDHGSQWRKKRLSSRSEMWSIWICDNQPGDAASFPGLPPATENGRRAQFHANWDEVMTILHTTHAATSAENSGGDAYEAPLQVVMKMKQNTSSPTDTYRVNYGEMTQAPAVGDYVLVTDTTAVDVPTSRTDPTSGTGMYFYSPSEFSWPPATSVAPTTSAQIGAC